MALAALVSVVVIGGIVLLNFLLSSPIPSLVVVLLVTRLSVFTVTVELK